jgi:molybdate transport system regulatory protein
MANKAVLNVSLRPRLRVQRRKDVALGPGKVALVAETGSIRVAAQRMEMSYMRAWTLIQTMNGCFKEPVIEAARGGKSGGGALLTATGREALALYQRMERSCLKSMEDDWRALRKLLRA